MGYYTEFTLQAKPVDEDVVIKIRDWLLEHRLLNYAFDTDYYLDDGIVTFYSCGEVKWYEHEEDMKELSEAFPDVKFLLRGDGENSDDVWNTVFQNGVYETRFMQFPPFSVMKW